MPLNPKYQEPNGRCMKLFHYHTLTGHKEYEHAILARKNEELCGKNGTYFSQKINL